MEESEMERKEEIRKIALSAGADICGFAGVDRLSDAPEGLSIPLPCDMSGSWNEETIF